MGSAFPIDKNAICVTIAKTALSSIRDVRVTYQSGVRLAVEKGVRCKRAVLHRVVGRAPKQNAPRLLQRKASHVAATNAGNARRRDYPLLMGSLNAELVPMFDGMSVTAWQ